MLGPEMKSAGEVMGIDVDFGRAYAKAELAAGRSPAHEGQRLPERQGLATSATSSMSRSALDEMGFGLIATGGTAKLLERYGIKVALDPQDRGRTPNAIDLIINK